MKLEQVMLKSESTQARRIESPPDGDDYFCGAYGGWVVESSRGNSAEKTRIQGPLFRMLIAAAFHAVARARAERRARCLTRRGHSKRVSLS